MRNPFGHPYGAMFPRNRECTTWCPKTQLHSEGHADVCVCVCACVHLFPQLKWRVGCLSPASSYDSGILGSLRISAGLPVPWTAFLCSWIHPVASSTPWIHPLPSGACRALELAPTVHGGPRGGGRRSGRGLPPRWRLVEGVFQLQ